MVDHEGGDELIAFGHRDGDVLDVLEELMLSPNADIADAAETALERLARPPQSDLADAALRVLFSNGTLRHARALAKCQELGAQIIKGAPVESMAASIARPTSPPVVNRILMLDENWTGGDDGLRYATRLFPGEVLAIHVGNEAAVTEQGLREVQMRRSYVFIRREGEPCLGIVADYQGELGAGVRISEVAPGSPAAVAGLRRGDVIYELGGRRVVSSASLRRISLQSHPGERIELRVQRGSRSLRVKLALGSDFATGDCQCVASTATGR